jgi:hypothetical protein
MKSKGRILKTTILWILALMITIASAVYQRKTGPTYPLEGRVKLGNQIIDYELLRSHGGEGDQPVELMVPDHSVEGYLIYRRLNSSDDWNKKKLRRTADKLYSTLPHQPPAGKLQYRIELKVKGKTVQIPPGENVITRFKGEVPALVLIPHIIFMFSAMLLSTRTGIEAFRSARKLSIYTWWTVILLFWGGLVMGPWVQKYAFDAYWTGFPFGTDLTDNKTLVSFIVWLLALFAVYRKSKPRLWCLAASIVTFIIFLIPHSLHGSELDYNKINTENEISANFNK